MPVTASSSAIGPSQPLQDAQGVPGGTYVVHPQPPHALPGEVDGECGVGVLALLDRPGGPAGVREEPTEEGLPARAHQDPVAERLQRVEVAQQLPVVLTVLGEAQAGVQDDP